MTLLERLASMPTQGVALPYASGASAGAGAGTSVSTDTGTGGFVRYRASSAVRSPFISASKAMASDPAPLILLHGIGSGSGSWMEQLCDERLGRVLAWDAPGYADSTPLKMREPIAADYAAQMWAWLDALHISSVHLVGHSLGCIMAASAARLQSSRIQSLMLLAPAQGYATAPEEVRREKRDARLQAMQQLGLQKMAEQRAPRLLSPHAPLAQVELATAMMSRLNEGGYAQATQMLSSADIRADLSAFRHQSDAPIRIASGDLDIITPPADCQSLAQFIAAPYTSIKGAGHVCALEAPQVIADLLIHTMHSQSTQQAHPHD